MALTAHCRKACEHLRRKHTHDIMLRELADGHSIFLCPVSPGRVAAGFHLGVDPQAPPDGSSSNVHALTCTALMMHFLTVETATVSKA